MGIRIDVDNKWVITSDQYQFILNEKKVIKEGKNIGEERLEKIGYYPKISQLISGLIHHSILNSTITSLSELSQEINRISEMLIVQSKDGAI